MKVTSYECDAMQYTDLKLGMVVRIKPSTLTRPDMNWDGYPMVVISVSTHNHCVRLRYQDRTKYHGHDEWVITESEIDYYLEI